MESTAVERISKIKLFRGSPFPEVADGGQVRYRSGDAASLKYLRSRERHENRGGKSWVQTATSNLAYSSAMCR